MTTDETVETRKPVDACPIDSVTVFVDRAEVSRSVAFDAPCAGTHSLVIAGLAESANTDSIRVKGLAGTAPCTILEVSFDVHTLPVAENADATDREASARAARTAAQDRVTAINAELQRLQQTDAFVSKYVTNMLETKGHGSAPAAGAELSTVQSLLSFHADKGAEIDARVATLRKDLSSAEQELEIANAQLADLSRSSRAKTVRSRDVTIVLAVPAAGALALSLTYLVSKASWSPSYDARVEMQESGTNTIQLTYFGVVKQSTGEDWTAVSLSLSTASPATGGNPPLPPTRVAQWRRPKPPPMRGSRLGHVSNMTLMQAEMPIQARMTRESRQTSLCANELDEDDDEGCDIDSFAGGGGGAAVATAAVEGGAGSATFVIERRSSIASDNKEHKVTVTILELAPTLRLFATPALEELAYLQARTINSSAFPLLESNRVAVFFNGSFVSTTAIKPTSPGESFMFFLGVDSSVKIEHRLIKKTANTGEKQGLMSFGAKDKATSRLLYEYCTLVHNTRKHSVELTLVELLPRSSDDKISVELLVPAAATVKTSGEAGDAASGEGALKSDGVMRNKVTNNVVFTRTLKPQSKLEIPFSYSVSWPHDAGTGEVEIS